MRLIIAGSRTAYYSDVIAAMETFLETHDMPTLILSGTAGGADTAGEVWAYDHGIKVKRYPAHWEIHGRMAGFLRNVDMANNADALVAVWNGQSSGTKHMLNVAERKGLDITIHLFQHPRGGKQS